MRNLSVKELKMVAGGLANSGGSKRVTANTTSAASTIQSRIAATPALAAPGFHVTTIQNSAGVVTGANWADNYDNWNIGGSVNASANTYMGSINSSFTTTSSAEDINSYGATAQGALSVGGSVNSQGIVTGTVTASWGSDSAAVSLGSNGSVGFLNHYSFSDGQLSLGITQNSNGDQTVIGSFSMSDGNGSTCQFGGSYNTAQGWSMGAYCNFGGGAGAGN